METHEEQALRAVEAQLRTHKVEVPDFAQARVSAGIHRQLRRSILGWGHVGFVACATALMLAVRFMGPLDGPATSAPAVSAPIAPGPSWLVQGAVSEVGPARVTVALGAEIEIAGTDSQPVLRLWRGQVDFNVAVHETPLQFEVQTRQARLQGFGARFSVQADETATFVRVQAGAVKVFAGAETQTVSAHRQIRIGPPLKETKKMPARVRKSAHPSPLTIEHDPPPAVNLKDVRSMLGRDAEKAGALAQSLILTQPAAPVRLEALLLLADARRRSGRHEDAVDAYRAILDHPERRAFEEEARYQLAHLLHGLSRDSQAIKELAVAHRLHAEGALGPERCALWASILFESGDISGAARVLETAPRGWSRVLDAQRLQVAQGLLVEAPVRAAKLAGEVVGDAQAPDLVEAARKIISTARKIEASSRARQPMTEP
jgi:hypothetical protein